MDEHATTTPKKIADQMTIDSSSAEWWSTWSDWLKVAGFVLGGLVTAIAVVGWAFSLKAGKLKDEASRLKEATLERFKIESALSISEADAKAAEANKIAAAANARAAVSELELARIKAAMQPRRFTDVQVAAMIPVFRSFPRRPKIQFWYRQPNAEAHGFGDHIADILSAAGFTEGSLNGMWDKRLADGKHLPDGIWLNSLHPDQEFIQLFDRAFKAAGVEVPTMPIEAGEEAPILCIGHKK